MLIIICLACGCTDSGTQTDVTTTDPTANDTTAPTVNDTTTGDNTQPEIPIDPDNLNIVYEGKSNYKIIVSANISTSLSNAVSEFREKLYQKTKINLEFGDDYIIPIAGIVERDCEILIGSTNRQATKDVQGTLKYDDYVIRAVDQKLVILGGSDEATIKAVQKFISDCMGQASEGNFKFAKTSSIDSFYNYRIDNLTVNGNEISEYKIVYPYGDEVLQVFAESFRTNIRSSCGHIIEVIPDIKYRSGSKALVIGEIDDDAFKKAAEVGEGSVEYISKGNTLQIVGGATYETVRGLQLLFERYFLSSSAATGDVDIALNEKQTLDMGELRSAMSFNVLYLDVIPKRIQLVTDAILSEMPDSIGIQECTQQWLNALESGLSEYYARVGEADEPSRLWYNPIFYRKDKLNLIETKTLWLSDTPNEISKYPESDMSRIVTYALFEDKATGERYAHFNTHLAISSAASSRQWGALSKIMSACPYPIVLTGDFNITPTDTTYVNITNVMTDARRSADVSTNDWTCDSKIMDFCFISSEVIASSFEVVNDPYVDKITYDGGDTKGQSYYLSDHYPIRIDFRLIKK